MGRLEIKPPIITLLTTLLILLKSLKEIFTRAFFHGQST